MEIVLIEKMKFDANGLVPAIVQDAATNEVLMMAYTNIVNGLPSAKRANGWKRMMRWKEF